MLNHTLFPVFLLWLKLVSIMLSCVWFSHPLSWEQWSGAVSRDFNPSPTFYQTFSKLSIITLVFLIMFRFWFLVQYMLEASCEMHLRNFQFQKRKRTVLQARWTDLWARLTDLQAPWRRIHEWRVLCCIFRMTMWYFKSQRLK